MYSEFATDPKVQSMPEAMQRRLVMLFCLECGGELEKLSPDEVAFALRIDDATLHATLQLFFAKGFCDENGRIINWNKRQFKSDNSTERSKKHRAKTNASSNATAMQRPCNVAATPPDTDTDTDTEYKKELSNDNSKKPPPRKFTYTPEFLKFWEAYPYQKGSKAKAQELYDNALKNGVSHDELLRAAIEYAGFIRATGTERRFTKNADTWLGSRERHWETDWGAASRQALAVAGGGAGQHAGDGSGKGEGGAYRNGSASRRESPHDVFARAWAHAAEKYSEPGRVADA